VLACVHMCMCAFAHECQCSRFHILVSSHAHVRVAVLSTPEWTAQPVVLSLPVYPTVHKAATFYVSCEVHVPSSP